MSIAKLSDERVMIRSAREIARTSGPFLKLELDVPQAMGLLGTLQLAMRHPNYGGNVRHAMGEIASQLEFALQGVGPATAELCQRGWAPDHDID
jgi:hypothetical protein